jgi:hypothetical protein
MQMRFWRTTTESVICALDDWASVVAMDLSIFMESLAPNRPWTNATAARRIMAVSRRCSLGACLEAVER